VRRLATLVLGVALAAVLVACGGDDPPVAAAGFDTRTVEAGEVTVTITPTRLDGAGATFNVVLDTHSVDLDLDLAASSALKVGDEQWNGAVWDGSGPGGHHREGSLAFTAGNTEPSGTATLTIGGLPEPVSATWPLPEGT
jgi:hypothetical protein